MPMKRGRPPKLPEDKVLSNGLFPSQWERLTEEARIRGYEETAPFLRFVVDEFFAQLDAESASAGAVSDEEDDIAFESLTDEEQEK